MARNNSKRVRSKRAYHPLVYRISVRNKRFREFVRNHNEMIKQLEQQKGGDCYFK